MDDSSKKTGGSRPDPAAEPDTRSAEATGSSTASLGSALLRGGRAAAPLPRPNAAPSAARTIEELLSSECDEVAARSAIARLLAIGEAAAAPLLDALQSDISPACKRRVGATLVAIGDAALPALRKRLSPGAPVASLRPAIQLAGAIGNDSLIDSLRSILFYDDPELRFEAAEALARIDGSRAAAALADAIASSIAGVAEAAARGLGALALRGRTQGVLEALLAALDQSLASRDLPLAREVMRSLVRMNATEAVPPLRDLLQRAPLLRRGRHRSLQRLAIETLARLPGEEASLALRAVARRGRRPLRRYARRRLARQAKRQKRDATADSLQ